MGKVHLDAAVWDDAKAEPLAMGMESSRYMQDHGGKATVGPAA